MKEQIKFFIGKRKLLWILGLGALTLIFIYLITFNSSPIGGLSVDIANSIWNILISLSTGYLISLIFYIMLVFKSEYSDFRKKINISKRVYNYYLRIGTSIDDLFNILVDCTECNSIQDFINSDIDYVQIKEDIIEFGQSWCEGRTCEEASKICIRNVNENLQRIDPYLTYLNEKATDLFIGIQQTYIFENVENGQIFDMAMITCLTDLVNVREKLRSLTRLGASAIV